ncbi:MAG: hypothetical protein J6B04_06785 [Clostridia bacterium]|nr:hypothetical protein [Clostridia bacterium]
MDIKNEQKIEKERVVLGIFGCVITALIGGAIWYGLYQLVGFLAVISAVVIAGGAKRGYAILAKTFSLKGAVISTIVATLTVILAWYLCASHDLFVVWQQWIEQGIETQPITFGKAIILCFEKVLLSNAALLYWGDLAVGLIIVGLFSYDAFCKATKNKSAIK